MTKSKERANERAQFPWAAMFVGVPLLGAWLAACAAAFLFVLNNVGSSEAVLQAVAWPITLIALGMPLIVAFMFGGMQLARQMLAMKDFFDNLPLVVNNIEKLTASINSATESANDASSSARAAAEAADEANVQVANAATADTVLVERFFKHYERAKAIFLAAMNKLDQWSRYPRYLQNDREEAIEALKRGKLISPEEAAYIVAAIDTERNTRRWSRSNLDQPQVDELERLSKQAGVAI